MNTSREEIFVLYQPNPTKQILLYDMATSSSVLTFLKMKNITTSIKNVTNSEFMSTNGRLPVVLEKSSVNNEGEIKLMCGFDDVYWHVTRKSDETPTLLELSYMDWVQSKFLEAEMYICWFSLDLETYTKPRYTYDLPWPLSTILFHRKRRHMMRLIGRKFSSHEDFLDKFRQFLSQLNKRIGTKTYCLSDSSPSCVDALIYGHTKAIMTIVPDQYIVGAITEQRRINHLVELIDRNYPSL